MSKYNARQVKADGYTFDSQAEYHRYQELRLMQAAGAISGLRVHPRYVLIEPCVVNGQKLPGRSYEGDFEYVEDGRCVCEDVKGMRTGVYKLKRALFLRRYPSIEHREVEA